MVLVSIHGLIDRLMILPRPLMIRSEKKLFAIEKDKTMPFGVCCVFRRKPDTNPI